MSKSDGQKRGISPTNKLPAGVSCEICKQPDDSRMVACDQCGRWFHFACVGEDSSVQDRDWSCAKCIEVGAAAQVPARTSTPATAGGTKPKSASTKSQERGPDDNMQRQLADMQRKMDRQLKDFERAMREKDDQRRKALKEQQEKFEQVLVDSERRLRERDVFQPAAASLGGAPAASSTGNPLPQVHVGGVNHADVLAQELQLLEEKQALERRHLEEKSQLLHRFGAFDGGVADGRGVAWSIFPHVHQTVR